MPERKLSDQLNLCGAQVCMFIQFRSLVTFTGNGRIKKRGGGKERRCYGHFNYLEMRSVASFLFEPSFIH